MEFLNRRGYNISVPSSAVCELLNRWRRRRGVHPARIRRGGDTDGAVRVSGQSWLSCEERGQGLLSLTSLRISRLHSWIFLFFFLPRFPAGGRRSLGLDLAYTSNRVREDVCGLVRGKVSWNVFSRIWWFVVVTYLFCRVSGVLHESKKWHLKTKKEKLTTRAN